MIYIKFTVNFIVVNSFIFSGTCNAVMSDASGKVSTLPSVLKIKSSEKPTMKQTASNVSAYREKNCYMA